MIEYLISIGCNPNSKTNDGRIHLHFASLNGHFPIVQYFIETLHIDKDIKDNDGYLALHYASQNGHLPIIEYLISYIYWM